MSSSGIIIAVRCMDCSKQVSPFELIPIGLAAVICFECYMRQVKALEGWTPPKECALCHATFSELALREVTETVKMYPHLIDGRWGMLCAPCNKSYVLKRQDQFGDTPFGRQLGLK